MKAPDKIYLQACGSCDSEEECKDCKWEALADNTTWCEDRIFKRDIEYIRKDALLEWVKEKIKESLNNFAFHASETFVEVLDKLNEM